MTAEDEIARLQQLMFDKMAEIGAEPTMPVSFMSIEGKLYFNFSGVWEDTKPIEDTLEIRDEFEGIVQATKLDEAEKRKQAFEEQQREALRTLGDLTIELDDDDE